MTVTYAQRGRIEEIAKNFRRVQRNDDVIYVYEKDDKFKELIRELHEGLLPNDFIFESVYHAVGAIIECLANESELDEVMEYQNLFITNRDVSEWHLQFSSYVQDAIDSYGIDISQSHDLFQVMQYGHDFHRTQITHAVMDFFELEY